MTQRKVAFKPASDICPCPECGNKTIFTIKSEQVAEDYCNLWAECICGYTHDSDYMFEDVWGGVDNDNVMIAIKCWNDAIQDKLGSEKPKTMTTDEESK